ncbi:MAG: peroxiredoxin-like family protein [Synechococcaceae cyanobacterium]
MHAPDPLRQRLAAVPGMGPGRRRLVLLLPQLGDFDSVEYAQALVPALPRLEAAGIALFAIGIGEAAGADRFCAYTGFPRACLQVDATPALHRALGLYEGLAVPGGPWASLLLMCAGLGSPGTLKEVFRGYTGDRSAPPRLATPLFDLVGRGFQRPFELATVRLANMREVLGAWGTYVSDPRWIAQRGGTFLLEVDDTVLYHHLDPGILGFSETMADPLRFLTPWLEA